MEGSDAASPNAEGFKDEDEKKGCPVCSEMSDGIHFGINCCRACAAFFRRSVALKKKYACRAGKNKCEIHKTVRAMCKKCRLSRCFERGMLAENVQQRRDPIGPKHGEAPEEEDDDDEKPPIPNVLSEIEQLLSPMPSTSSQPTVTATEAPELLLKIHWNYKTMCAVRKATELAVTNSTRKTLQNFFSNSIEPLYVPAIHRTNSEFTKMVLPTFMEFISNCYSEYNTFTTDEKWVIFQNFVLIMLIFDSAYRTAKHWTPETTGTMVLVTMTTYLDSEVIYNYLAPDVHNRDELHRLLREAIETGPRTRLARRLYESNLTDEEFAALLALTMWHSNLENASERIQIIAHSKRKEIYKQLHLYYTSLGNNAYAERMGEVLNYQSMIFFCAARFRENMELCNLFHKIQDGTIFQIVRNEKPDDF